MTETLPELKPGTGGWNGEVLRHASPTLRARVQQAEAEFARELRQQEALDALEAEQAAHRRLQASVEAAQARGEAIDAARVAREGGLGRTRAEAVAWYSAQADVDDRRREALEQRQMRSLLAEMDEHAVAEHVGRPATSTTAVHAAAVLAAGAGRTHREAIAYYSAQGDLQDAMATAQAQREIRVLRDGLPTDKPTNPDMETSSAIRAAHRRIRARAATR